MLSEKTHKCRRLQFPWISGLERAIARPAGILAAFVVVLAAGPAAQAQLTCGDIGGVPSGDDCTLSVEFTCPSDPTWIDIPGDLTITGTGAITCGSFDLDLDVGGDLDVQSGGEITADGADNNGSGSSGGQGGPGAAGDAGDPADGMPCTPGVDGDDGADGEAGGTDDDAPDAGNLDIDVEGDVNIAGEG